MDDILCIDMRFDPYFLEQGRLSAEEVLDLAWKKAKKQLLEEFEEWKKNHTK